MNTEVNKAIETTYDQRLLDANIGNNVRWQRDRDAMTTKTEFNKEICKVQPFHPPKARPGCAQPCTGVTNPRSPIPTTSELI